jgi:hypothetical protein
MLKRLLPLLVALAVAGAPVALEACHVACAPTMASSATTRPTMAGASQDGGHSCHDTAPADGPQLSHALHACDESAENQPPASRIADTQRSSGAIPLALVAVSSVAVVTPAPTLTFWPTLSPHPLRPTRFSSATPLRI